MGIQYHAFSLGSGNCRLRGGRSDAACVLGGFPDPNARRDYINHCNDGSMGRLYIYLHEWLIFMVNVYGIS